jgi:hypothetical protein
MTAIPAILYPSVISSAAGAHATAQSRDPENVCSVNAASGNSLEDSSVISF